MTRSSYVIALALAACGGSGPRATTPAWTPSEDEPKAWIRLEPAIGHQVWYRSASTCGQGPYELEVPIAGAKYGEEIELRVHAPRAIALHAEMVVDSAIVATSDDTFGVGGRTTGKPDNARCRADTRELLALGRPGSGGGRPGIPGTPGTVVPAGAPGPVRTACMPPARPQPPSSSP